MFNSAIQETFSELLSMAIDVNGVLFVPLDYAFASLGAFVVFYGILLGVIFYVSISLIDILVDLVFYFIRKRFPRKESLTDSPE